MDRLPLDLLGYPDMPAVPFSLLEIPDTLVRLGLRFYATTQAKWGLNNVYQIGEVAANGYSYLYGRGKDAHAAEHAEFQALQADLERSHPAAELHPDQVHRRLDASAEPPDSSGEDPITRLALTDAEQFAMSWTTSYDVYAWAKPILPIWTATLRDPEIANREFWPMIAQHGFAYNLLILKKVDRALAADYQQAFGEEWTPEVQQLFEQQRLFAIDLRLYRSLPVSRVKGNPRFTPATLTLLSQDPQDKSLQPIKVMVMGRNEVGKQVFTYGVASAGAWLYALQAAKTSITLYGIWMGHVYHWHLVSAALVMTLNNHVEESHPLRQFMAPQTSFLIPFDNVLLLLWSQIAPPTSVSSPKQFLAMINEFAKGRAYLQDDPDATLAANGIVAADFSVKRPWDQYPIAGQLSSVFGATNDYVTAFVNHTWADDAAVLRDRQLQAWHAASSDPKDGNVQGIPPLSSRANLIIALRSWVFRLTAHGASRLNNVANRTLTYIPNFPPCLQREDIPSPSDDIDTERLLEYLPRTGTMGEMLNFFYIFAFSSPYIPFLPIAGNDVELIWGDDPREPRNAALIAYRRFLESFIKTVDDPPQIFQWPRNIET